MEPYIKKAFLPVFITFIVCLACRNLKQPENSWVRHTIDASLGGADGVRLADLNHDGKPDIATSWEQSGVVRIYFHPGTSGVKRPWEYVNVGSVGSVEDAFPFDFDGNGRIDIVSSCEGTIRSIFFHRAPDDLAQYRREEFWKTIPLHASYGSKWMFSDAAQIDGKLGIDLIAGGKNQNAQIGWFESPVNPADVSQWVWHPVSSAGWVMSLKGRDLDGDGDQDILGSDRYGSNSSAFWLENPGPDHATTGPWNRHMIGGKGMKVLFLNEVDLDQDTMMDIVAAVREKGLLFFRREHQNGKAWRSITINTPRTAGTPKAVAGGDINLDGRIDLVYSCEEAKDKFGVMWLESTKWNAHNISGLQGTKFDLVELIDLDADGDLDVLTTEEKSDLGIIWYENPFAATVRSQRF